MGDAPGTGGHPWHCGRRPGRQSRSISLSWNRSAWMRCRPGTGLLIEARELEEEETAVAADIAALETEPDMVEGLDALHTQILCVLVHGGSPAALIKENHLMPAVAADTINAALFDVFDDNVIECEGDELLVVADYQEDILQMLGGDKDE